MTLNYDITKERPELYRARRAVEVVDVPSMPFLMADGLGNANESPDYVEVVEAVFVTSYAVRAVAKEELGRTHTVGPLEGLWTAADLEAFRSGRAEEWEWTRGRPGTGQGQEEGGERCGSGEIRELRRGQVRPGPPRRTLRRGGADHRAIARGIHCWGRPQAAWFP
jgi:hypothetical protein